MSILFVILHFAFQIQHFLLFSCDRRYNLSCTSVVSELTKVYSLPSAEIQSAVGDWNSKAVADEGALCVGWHIVVAFKGVLIIGLTFLHHTVEDALHVDADIWICVLIDGQSADVCLMKRLSNPTLGNAGR